MDITPSPQMFTLPDGRRLSYDQYGPASGHPVFYFHGSPSSRLDIHLMAPDFLHQGPFRMISVDRPGMGRSDFQPGRGFSHWAEDVAALAGGLGLEKFAVMGVSGGGGYVAACARFIPGCLTAALIVSGAGRMDWPEATAGLTTQIKMIWKLARWSPLFTRAMLALMRTTFKGDRAKFQKQMSASLPPADAALFADPRLVEVFAAAVLESMRQGVRGPAWDMRLYVQPWDFHLEEIDFPVTLLHGEADANVPVAVARRVAAAIPGCRAVFYSGEAHLSTGFNHLDAIVAALTPA